MADLLEVLRSNLASRYAIEEEIGRGGMAYVYRAQDLKHGRMVAIKVLRPELSAVLGAERFVREIQLTATLNHPRVLAIHDSGSVGGLLYYVMPLIDGESLRARIDRERQLPVEDAVAITRSIASALSYAHTQRVVHRDIKPENIMLANGDVIVADFGIGRALETTMVEQLTESGLALGTPEYMSPEQASADPHVDGRSDQFSLGCVLYEMLVGEPPFRGPTIQAVVARRMTEPMPSICAVRRGVSPAIEEVARKSLAKAPADRYPTMTAFSDALLKAGAETANPRPVRTAVARAAWGASLLAAFALVAYGVTHRGRAAVLLAPPAGTDSIAVQVFQTDSAHSRLSMGLVIELIAQLKKIPHLLVTPLATTLAYKDSNLPNDSLGKLMHARALVTGTLRQSNTGDTVQIALSFVNAADNSSLGASVNYVPNALSFALEDSIVYSIVDRLKLRLEASTRAMLSDHGTTNQEAQDRYLQGRQLLADRFSNGNALKARDAFRGATQLDPSYAQAWAGLSAALTFTGISSGEDPASYLAAAKAAAIQAIALDRNSAEAHLSLAILQQQAYKDDLSARAELDTAVALEPTNAEVHLFLAWSHIFRHEFPEALAEARKATALDDKSAVISLRLGTMLYTNHEYDAAMAQLKKVIVAAPQFYMAHMDLAAVYREQRRCPEALAQYDSVPSAVPMQEAGNLGFIAAACGKPEIANSQIARLKADLAHGKFVLASQIASAYLGLHDRAQFLAWFQKAVEEHDPVNPFDPIYEYDGMNRDPAFKKILSTWKVPGIGN